MSGDLGCLLHDRDAPTNFGDESVRCPRCGRHIRRRDFYREPYPDRSKNERNNRP